MPTCPNAYIGLKVSISPKSPFVAAPNMPICPPNNMPQSVHLPWCLIAPNAHLPLSLFFLVPIFPKCPFTPMLIYPNTRRSQRAYWYFPKVSIFPSLHLFQSPTCPYVPKIGLPIFPKVPICSNFVLMFICPKCPYVHIFWCPFFPSAYCPRCSFAEMPIGPKVPVSQVSICFSPQHAHLPQSAYLPISALMLICPKCPLAQLCPFFLVLICPMLPMPICPNAYIGSKVPISPNLHFSQAPTCPFGLIIICCSNLVHVFP